MTAWVNGILGTLLVFAIAMVRLHLSEVDAALCVVGSNVAGFVSLLLYSFGGRQPWIRRHLLHGPLRTWVLFLAAYLGLLLLFAPALRTRENFEWLIIPTILATGFCILAYGPIQDHFVARAQRRIRG